MGIVQSDQRIFWVFGVFAIITAVLMVGMVYTLNACTQQLVSANKYMNILEDQLNDTSAGDTYIVLGNASEIDSIALDNGGVVERRLAETEGVSAWLPPQAVQALKDKGFIVISCCSGDNC